MFNKSDFKFLDDLGDERYFSLYEYIFITVKHIISDYDDPYWELNIYEDFPYLTGVDYSHDNVQLKEDFANQFNNFTIEVKRKFIEAVLMTRLDSDSKFLKIVEPYHA